jgi:hypothetical protein
MYKRDINEKKHIRRKEEEEDVGRKTNYMKDNGL